MEPQHGYLFVHWFGAVTQEAKLDKILDLHSILTKWLLYFKIHHYCVHMMASIYLNVHV